MSFSDVQTAFADALAITIGQPLSDWLDAAACARGAADFLKPLTERLDEPALAERFMQHCPVEGAGATDYQTQRLTLPGGLSLLAGIRFKGGDMAEPFVEVAADRPLDGTSLPAVQALVREHFAVFKPRALRFWRAEAGEGQAPEGLTRDQTYFVAPVAALRERPWPGSPRQLSVRPATDLSGHPRLVAAYEAYAAQAPAIAAEISVSPPEDLAESLAAGLLFEAYDGDTWAGLIAATREPFFGQPGFSVLEELLTADYRGRGLAPVLQRHLIDHLPNEPHALLHGTIHDRNQPSRRTALRVGRHGVLTAYFSSLEAAPRRPLGPDAELRPMSPDCAEAYYALVEANRAYLARWINYPASLRSLAETREKLDGFARQHTANRGLFYGLWHQGHLVGEIMLFNLNEAHQSGELGYWLAADHQGHGLITRGCAAVLDEAFNRLSLNRVELRCVVENEPSARVPARLGFTREGTLHGAQYLHGRFVDNYLFGLLAERWRQGV